VAWSGLGVLLANPAPSLLVEEPSRRHYGLSSSVHEETRYLCIPPFLNRPSTEVHQWPCSYGPQPAALRKPGVPGNSSGAWSYLVDSQSTE
jgi:hypothetical protein